MMYDWIRCIAWEFGRCAKIWNTRHDHKDNREEARNMHTIKQWSVDVLTVHGLHSLSVNTSSWCLTFRRMSPGCAQSVCGLPVSAHRLPDIQRWLAQSPKQACFGLLHDGLTLNTFTDTSAQL